MTISFITFATILINGNADHINVVAPRRVHHYEQRCVFAGYEGLGCGGFICDNGA